MDVEKEVQSLIRLCQSGQMKLAETRCKALLDKNNSLLKVQWLLVEIYLFQKRYQQILDTVYIIASTQSNSLSYINEIAAILVHDKQPDIAQKCYLKYLDIYPQSANAHYDVAVLQKKLGLLDEALNHYKQSLKLTIDRPEIVHLNIAVIYSELRQEKTAKEYLDLALNVNPSYIPALFNLATLHEEWGEKQQALDLYQKILVLTPDNIEVSARIINAKKMIELDDPLLTNLKNSLTAPKIITQLDKESGHFALGKAYDDCKQFELAFKHYNIGNDFCAQRSPAYNTGIYEQHIKAIIQTFSKQWIAKYTQTSNYEPVFICGMFRSGTSLIEQILAAHDGITPGGELSLISNAIKDIGYQFPNDFADPGHSLQHISDSYVKGIETLFPNTAMVTDKKPNNFVYLGLLKAIFPKAKFICTVRNPLDVCISVYFQHLGNELPYSNKLLSIAHYFTQYIKLMRHWKKIMPESMLMVDYDRLVVSQTAVTENLLNFCDLPWRDKCLEFYKHENSVKTASVWQVRQPIYQTSVRRSEHYAQYLYEAESYLAKHLPEGYADLMGSS